MNLNRLNEFSLNEFIFNIQFLKDWIKKIKIRIGIRYASYIMVTITSSLIIKELIIQYRAAAEELSGGVK